jgi:hypothetical protein
MGHAAFIKKARMRKADALLHELEQHLLKQKARLLLLGVFTGD